MPGWGFEFFLWPKENHLENFMPRNVDFYNPTLRDRLEGKAGGWGVVGKLLQWSICETPQPELA